MTIDAGRGCPFACVFCSTKTFWNRRYRLRNIDDVLDEINHVRNLFGEKIYSFSHDLFTADKTRIIEFCDKIDTLPFKIKWTCSSRIDCINENLIDRMIRSGLVAIYYGIETGSQSMQRRINKNLNIDRCREIVSYSIKQRISVVVSFICGFPDETVEDFEETLRLMMAFLEQGADVQIHRLQFEPGTKLYDDCIDRLEYRLGLSETKFAEKDLEVYIKNDKDIFSIFWDLPSKTRDGMQMIEISHSILKIYPKAYIKLFQYFSHEGMTYLSIYKLIFNLIGDSLKRLAKKHVKISKSISNFIYMKLLSELNDIYILDKNSIKNVELQTLVNDIAILIHS